MEGDVSLSRLLRAQGVRDERVLAAVAALCRSRFVPASLRASAEQDRPLPIGYGQTISQPYVVATMSEALGLRGAERVLEIGTGSGYQTAVLALLCAEVYSMEIVPELAEAALERFGQQAGIRLRLGDGNLGWPEAAPFDAIVLTAAPLAVPRALFEQLKPGGRLVAPVGGQGGGQRLLRYTKLPDGTVGEEALFEVRFVPMTGRPLNP